MGVSRAAGKNWKLAVLRERDPWDSSASLVTDSSRSSRLVETGRTRLNAGAINHFPVNCFIRSTFFCIRVISRVMSESNKLDCILR